MSFLDKLFAPTGAKTVAPAVKPAVPYDIELVPNVKYRTTRQMFLFPKQDVVADVNDYLLIGAVVTYLERGESFEDNHLIAPWVRVRSAKGKEGWCFAHYLVPVSGGNPAKGTKGAAEHWASATAAISIWNGTEH
jgi:hypothetical protein